MQRIRPYVLTIGGFDSSAGAGVLADVKTMEQLGVMGLAVLTANTIQSEATFTALRWEKLADVLQGVEVMMRYYSINYLKIGIVPDAHYLSAIVSQILESNPNAKIIWDPVLSSSSGQIFFDKTCSSDLSAVLSKLYLITPNILEYNQLRNKNVLGETILQNCAILQKGGHRSEQVGLDVLITNNDRFLLEGQKNIEYAKHGSGCVLSSAILAYLSQGYSLHDACQHAKKYIEKFLNSNSSLLGFHHDKNS